MQLPQVPPQPSGPHCFPVHDGTHAHWLVVLQVWGEGQVPQLPPQPSLPHWALHDGRQVHWPLALQTSLPAQVPQVPPQPSGPQVRPLQAGVHTQAPAVEQLVPVPQVPQAPPQPSSPQALPVQLGEQLALGSHCPAAVQFSLGAHIPHTPPQLSLPHARPLHEGVQAEVESAVRWLCSKVSSQPGSTGAGGIVLSATRARMRSLHLRTSASVSKSTPTVAPPRAPPVTFTEWQDRQRVEMTPGPSEAPQSCGPVTVPGQPSSSGATARKGTRRFKDWTSEEQPVAEQQGQR